MMLKQTVTYEDFNGDTVTDVLYFNLTKSEIIEMELAYEGGLDATIQRLIKAENNQALLQEFKRIILAAYGEKSEDGKKFVKNDALRDEFLQTAAYDAFFIQLATDDKVAAAFVEGILPKDLVAEVKKQQNENPAIPVMAPPAPPTE
jgi:hypothetical protein